MARTDGRTPNDDRSDSLNPNSPAFQASLDNRSRQLNPEDERYGGDEKQRKEAGAHCNVRRSLPELLHSLASQRA